MFGSSHLYVFHHPQDAARQEKEGAAVPKVSFDAAQEEIAKNKGFDMDKTGKSKGVIILQSEYGYSAFSLLFKLSFLRRTAVVG